MKLEMQSESFAKINPMKKLPAIVDTDNNLSLAESHAIMRYLCQKFKIAEQWYPLNDLKSQARIN